MGEFYAYVLKRGRMRDVVAALLLIRGAYPVVGRGELPDLDAVTVITALPIKSADLEAVGAIPFENI